MSKFVDLSVVLNENTPVYPGDPPTKIEPRADWEKDGYRDSYVSIGTHAGTHVDAPFHMVEDGESLEGIPLENFSGRGVLIKMNGDFRIEDVKSVDIQEGDVVLFHTGMSEVYYQSEYFEKSPAMTEEIADYLVFKKVKMVGVDMCSIDHEPFPVHRILLRNKILIIENLTNLESLAGKNFRVLAFPIRTQLDGSPVRVVAEVDD